MRFIYGLTALLVAFTIYMVVIQREALLEFAGRGAPEDAPVEATAGAGGRPAGEPALAAGETGASVIEDAPDRIRVVAMPSRAREVETAVQLRGRTEAARQVEVRAETSGRIVNEPLRKGALVTEGEVLCRIDPGTRDVALEEARARLREARARLPEARARVAEAEARLAEAEINDRAAQSLSQSGFAAETRVAAAAAAVSSAKAQVETARAGLEGAQSAVRSAEAAVAAAETEIERLAIEAPFDGLLESDTAELGALMQPGQVCATVIQLDPIRIVGFVPEAQVARVTLGARAAAELVSGQRVTGRVTFVARSADPQTRTFRVEITARNPDLAIRDGQTAEIAIDADGAVAHLLPASALTLDDSGRLGVRTARAGPEGDVAAFVPVELIRDTPRGVLVTGLDEEVRVIVVGQEYVTDGVPIDVTLRETAPGAPDPAAAGATLSGGAAAGVTQ
jgi:multidrug efflux system membrane fusion protein